MSDYKLNFKANLDTTQVNQQLKNIQTNIQSQLNIGSGGDKGHNFSNINSNIDRAATTINLRQTSRALNLFGANLENAARQIGDASLGDSIKNLTQSTNTVIQGFNALGIQGGIIGGVVAAFNLISESVAGFADLQNAAKDAGDQLWGASNAVTSYSAAQTQLQAATVDLKNKMFAAQRSQANYFDISGEQKQAAKELRESAKAHREAALLLKQYSAKLEAAYSGQERVEELLYGPMEKRFSTSELENKASDLRSQLEGTLKVDPETVDDLDKFNSDLNNLINEYSKVSQALAKSRDVDTSNNNTTDDREEYDIENLLMSKNKIGSLAQIGGGFVGEHSTDTQTQIVNTLKNIENNLRGISSSTTSIGAAVSIIQ